MWVLNLNDMRSAKYEILKSVCKADTSEELEAFLLSEKVEPYSDGHAPNSADGKWHKVFRKGGPFEWFNEGVDYGEDRFLQLSEYEASLPEVKAIPTIQELKSAYP